MEVGRLCRCEWASQKKMQLENHEVKKRKWNKNDLTDFHYVSCPFVSICTQLPLPKPLSTPSLYTARACRHFIAATGDMVGERGVVDNVFWGEGVAGEMNRGSREGRNCWSLKGITLAPSMSSAQCCSQILSRGYLLTLPVCLSITRSVCLHLFFSQRWKQLFLLLWLCAFVLVSMALCYWLIFSSSCCFKGATVSPRLWK